MARTAAEAKHYRVNGGAMGTALRRRLETGRLTAEDEELIARAKVVRERRRQGRTYEQIADEFGLNRKMV